MPNCGINGTFLATLRPSEPLKVYILSAVHSRAHIISKDSIIINKYKLVLPENVLKTLIFLSENIHIAPEMWNNWSLLDW